MTLRTILDKLTNEHKLDNIHRFEIEFHYKYRENGRKIDEFYGLSELTDTPAIEELKTCPAYREWVLVSVDGENVSFNDTLQDYTFEEKDGQYLLICQLMLEV
jgi:hypothetical protein